MESDSLMAMRTGILHYKIKNKKKYLRPVLCILALACLLLSGCGSEEPVATDGYSTENADNNDENEKNANNENIENKENTEVAYLFVHFTSGVKDSEKVYFSVSEDGLHFKDLGGVKPVLTATKGTTGIRDPYIVYDENLKKYFIIATDLDTSDGDWGRAATRGSRSLYVWESEDLINWSEERLIEVGIEGAGCVWAPEAVYCKEKNAWFVFFASNVKEPGDANSKHRIYGCFTTDFVEFTPAFKYIERPNDVIDTDIVWEDGWYYRFSKDETTKVIMMEKSQDLINGPYEEVYSECLSGLEGVEGPECYYLENQKKWCLIVDQYSFNGGYLPLVTDDLSSGVFEKLDVTEYHLGARKKRHGGIIKITKEEMDKLIEHFGV